MEDINYDTLIHKRITIEPKMLNTNLEQYISELVKAKYGNQYLQEGYIKKESIKVIRRSMLQQIPNKFNGDMITNVIFSANVINPVKGNIIVGKISGINKAGFLMNNNPFIINVLIEQHDNKVLFKNLKVGDEVRVVVIATKYNQKNNTIMIIAKLEEEYNKKMKIKIKSKKSKKDEDILEKEYNEEIKKNIQEGGEPIDVDEDIDGDIDNESNKSENDEVEEDETESIENKKINNETGEEEFDESDVGEDDEDIDKDILDDELEDPEEEEESEEEETEEEEINHIEDAE